MADHTGSKAEQIIPLTEAPKENEDKGPSKSALKKAAKEKEKAEKAAKRAAAEEAARKEREAADANDVSKDEYGDLPDDGTLPDSLRAVPFVELDQLEDRLGDAGKAGEVGDSHVLFHAVVKNARSQSAKLAFLVLQEGFGTIQAVVAAGETLSKQMVKFASTIPSQSVVVVHALIKKPKDPVQSCTIQNLEAHIQKLYVECRAETQLPMQVEDAERPVPAENEEAASTEEDGRPIVTLNTRLNNRVIDLRARHNQAIFRIKDGVEDLFALYLRNKGFVGIKTPKLLGAASEGGANVFEIKYFNTSAYLAQSPQLYKQMLVAAHFPAVFEVGPIFRAENSNTARHLTEFTGLDLETRFQKDYHEIVSLIEDLMLFIFDGLKKKYGKETELVRTIYKVPEFRLPEAGKVPRLHFKEGIAMLREDGLTDIGDFDDLSTPDEKRLGALVLKKYGSDFYVLDKYPLAIRPFYTMPDLSTYGKDPSNPNAGYSNSYDFFMRGQEIMSGAQRIHKADLLKKRMREHENSLDPDSAGLRDYVKAFEAGAQKHAGGGLGLERIVMLWLGLPNVRLASLFPRDPVRLTP